MKIEIKSWVNSEVLFSCEAKDMKEAILKAIKEKADLTSADLRYADLTYADLTSANLRYANLTSADLTYANLTSAKGIFYFNFGVKIKVVK